jgi:hypothetical protein
MKKQHVWDFVEKYYPKYSSSQEICDANDLSKIVEGELNGAALEIFNDYIVFCDEKRNVALPCLVEHKLPDNWEEVYSEELAIALADYNELHVSIYEKAIEAFLERNERSITWSVEDFEGRAKDIEGEDWEKVYDKSGFQDALETMIRHHDCSHGITWDTIDYYLQKICRKNDNI